MNDTPPPIPDPDPDHLEADDAGTEGHDVPADLLELHGLLELAHNGGPA
jgi:hypothetical protein